MKTKLIALLTLAWAMLAPAQSPYAGFYGGMVDDTTFSDTNAGVFAVFVGTNGQATVAGYDVDSFQNYNGQAGGVAAQFNVPANGNWNFSSNNTIYGVSGSGTIDTDGSFSGTLNFTNGDTVQLNGSQQSPLGGFQNAAGFYGGTFSGNFGGQPVSGPTIGVLSANGQFVFCSFVNGDLNDGGQAQFGSNDQFTTTNLTSGTTAWGTLTNATLKIGGISSNSSGSCTWTMNRSNYVFGVATTNLAAGVTTVPYSQMLSAYGGPTNYSWGIISGGLPAGLSLSGSGVISGTPTTAQTNSFTVRATNALSVTATQALSLVIHAFSTSVTFAVTPAAVSNTYSGTVTLQAGNLASGETVVVQKFLDLNTNGIIDAGDWLVQQFTMTDGQAGMVIGGVTNFNVPGDTDGAANGQITANLNFQNGDFMQNMAGKFLYKLSSSIGHFAPLTNVFTVTNYSYGQMFTGNVVSNAAGGVVSNAVVLLLPSIKGSPLAGAVANNAGSYTIAAPPGTYALAAFRSNYLGNFGGAPTITLGSGATVTTNIFLTNATATISGSVVDASNSSIGLPGVLISAEGSGGLMGVGFTDTNGNFTLGVQSGPWSVRPDDTGLIVHGYLGLQNKPNPSAGATGVTIAVPKATALIYGSVTNNLGNPFVALDMYANDQDDNLYETDGYTDANGNYVLGVLGLGSNDPWWVDANDNNQLTNYIFTHETIDGNINAGTAVPQNFTGILAANQIAGNVEFNGTNLVGVGVWASATINGVYYQLESVDTDANGNYSFNVANGDWTVALFQNTYSDSLDAILGSGNYIYPGDQTAVIINNNAMNNFTLQPCSGVQILTTNLPNGQVNVYYIQYLQGSSCNGTLNWSLNDPQDFPSSLGWSGSGEIQGTPNTSGTNNFSVHLDDGNGHTADQNLSLYIAPASSPLQITTAGLPIVTNGIAYSQTLQASGGTPPYSWSMPDYSASLPPNLALATNGILSGTPDTSIGWYYFDVVVTDAANNSNEYDGLGLDVVNPPPVPLVITNASLPSGMVGVTYSAQLAAAGGLPPYTWGLAPGSAGLPAGLSLNTGSGAITGTPTTVKTNAFKMQVTDEDDTLTNKVFTIIISAYSPLRIASCCIAGTNLTINVTNGVSGHTYQLLAGTNLTLPMSQWAFMSTTNLSTSGNFSMTVTNGVGPAMKERFFILQQQ